MGRGNLELMEKYKTIQNISEGLYKEKGSKFFSYVYPCLAEEDAKELIQNLRALHPNAVHVCFAWRIGIDQYKDRYSDDGEPNNSAGKPIHGQIINFDVTNVLIAVVRYYGGVKLGVGGLITAYKTAAQDALTNNKIVTKELSYTLRLNYDFENTGNANIILSKANVNVIENGFDESGPFIKFEAVKKQVNFVQQQIEQFPTLELIEIQ